MKNQLKKALDRLRPRRKAGARITALCCSHGGHLWNSQQIYDTNRAEFLEDQPQEVDELYQKLLLRRPTRTRRYVTPYTEIAKERDIHAKWDRFHQGALDMMKETAQGLLEHAGLEPDQIDFLVVNYMAGKSLPSLSSHIAGEMGFREDIVSVNMGDMGCSAGVASVDLAVRLLGSEQKPKRALVMALEPASSLFQNTGSPGGVVGNTLFGDGCAGVVVSSDPRDEALYHIGPRQRILRADEESRDAIKLVSGDTGPMIQLSKKIGEVAGVAIEKNLKRLVPRILSTKDKLQYLITRKVPRWQAHIDHWALHPGGWQVLQGLQKSLRLAEADLGPSYRVFQERSNMSSPSVFYVLENIERGAPSPGERVLMMAFGSGFKANSIVLTKGTKRHPVPIEKRAVIIGGTSGIGLETARLLQREGYELYIGSRRVGTEAAYDRLEGATYLPLDVTDPQSVQAFSDQIWAETYGVDVLVVSSGTADAQRPMGREEPEIIERTIATNLTGAIHVVNAFLPRVKSGGSIFLMNSILGQIPLQGSSVYCATKAGLKHFAEAVELEVRKAGRKVRLHNLYPAYVDTPLLDDVKKKNSKLVLAPIPAPQAVKQVGQLLTGPSGKPHDGFVLPRDRALAGLYHYAPAVFKGIASSL